MLLKTIREQFRLNNRLYRCLLCEFVATTFLIYVGLCIDAQMFLSKGEKLSAFGHCIGWGLTLTLAVQCAYRCSGAHLNPAVSLFSWSLGTLNSLKYFWFYTIVQVAGAFVGAALCFVLYYDKIEEFDGGIRTVSGPNATAAIFATYPGSHLSTIGAVIDQIFSTAMLCFSLGIITDERNEIPIAAQPPLMGVMLAMLCMGFGLNSGNAMNPARDFGPRLFTLIAGYGWEVFSYNNYKWFWIPIFCPFGGALLGSWLYQILIGAQLDISLKKENLEPLHKTEEKISKSSLFTLDNNKKNSEERLAKISVINNLSKPATVIN
uniref:Aquaporin n=3 Tax=Meloidogyne incognita group TaxID=654580 RepID=A0A915LHJ0_MELJA